MTSQLPAVPITRPVIDDADIEAVVGVLRSGMLVQGPKVAEFERNLASIAGTAHAVAVSNCTVALELALRGMGIGPGHRVGVTAYSWVATVNAIEIVGAEPIMIDIDGTTFNMSARALEEALRRHPLDAVLPVHTFGNMHGFEELMAVAGAHGVRVLEDAACAIGAKSSIGNAGGIGVAGCLSFHPRKVITTGEGGAITTNDNALADFARTYRNHGQSGGGFTACGSNFRLTDFQAALGISQLAKLDRIVADRQRIAERYDAEVPGFGLTPQKRSVGSVVQSYVALVAPSSSAELTVARLRSVGVEATIGTVAIPLTPYHGVRFRNDPADFPVLADVHRRAVTLPLFPGMSVSDQDCVFRALAEGKM